ncbi:phage tail tube protein, partial [Vibrio fluvialis]|nr:phage tail tube protein [Vibrio fluvialis]
MGTTITSRAVLNAGSLGRLPIKEGAEIGFGNLKREAVMGDDGVLGHSEVYDGAPYIKATIVHAKA